MSITVEDIILNHKSAVDLAERLADEIERLQAEAAAMREALEAVEWVFRPPDTQYCPWCNHSMLGEHAPDCLRQVALAAGTGSKLLERMQIVQAQCDYQNEQIRRLEDALNEVRET